MGQTSQNKDNSLYSGIPFMKIRGDAKAIKFPCRAEIKMDGEFQYVIVTEGKACLLNKEEHGRMRWDMPVTNVNYPNDSIFLAELIYGNGQDFYDFARHKLSDDLNLVIFGCLRYGGVDLWKTYKPNGEVFNYDDTRTLLDKQTFYNERVCLCPSFTVNNQAELDTLFKKVVALGYEGLVLKQPKSTYFDGDSHEWAKMKHVADLDLAIVGFQTGTKKAKKLSVMVAYQKDGQLVNLTHVGGGFELAEKDALLPLLQKDAIGKVGIDEMVTPKYVATIQHYGIIHKADGTVSSLRHPQFKCLRPDKTIAQVDTL